MLYYHNVISMLSLIFRACRYKEFYLWMRDIINTNNNSVNNVNNINNNVGVKASNMLISQSQKSQACMHQKRKKKKKRPDLQSAHLAVFYSPQVFPDNFMRREIMQLVVQCKYIDLGCSWKGNVSHFEVNAYCINFRLCQSLRLLCMSEK